MTSSLLTKGNAWLTRLVAYPGDDEETLVVKKIWLSTGVAINLLSFASSFQWLFMMRLKTMFIMEMVYVGFYMTLIALFLSIRRGIDWFILATALFHIFFSFAGVCLHGGIVASAGLVFVGWGGGPVYLLLLQKNRKWAAPVQGLFMLTGIERPYSPSSTGNTTSTLVPLRAPSVFSPRSVILTNWAPGFLRSWCSRIRRSRVISMPRERCDW